MGHNNAKSKTEAMFFPDTLKKVKEQTSFYQATNMTNSPKDSRSTIIIKLHDDSEI